MKIQLNLDSLAVLLFCGDLVVDNTAALTQDEWLTVERKLKSSSRKTPSKLFGMNKDTLIDILQIEEYIAYKMIARLTTINDLLFALANLENEGISLTTKYEDNYPKILTSKLKKRAPLYLYYVGDLSITENHMVSVVGPQELEKRLNTYTKNIVTKIYDEEKQPLCTLPVYMYNIDRSDQRELIEARIISNDYRKWLSSRAKME